MEADPSQQPVVRSPEAETLDFEVVDEGGSSGTSPQTDLPRVSPEALVQAFRGMVREKLKRWCFRSMLWGGGLGLLAMENPWARWAFGIWACIAAIHLALLLVSWRLAARSNLLITKVFGGGTTPGGDDRRP